MNTKKFLVTNNGEGSICVSGRTRIDIPGLCKNLLLELPEATAKTTVARLKQRYPLLTFKEMDAAQADSSGQIAKTPDTSGSHRDSKAADAGTNANKTPETPDSHNDSKPDTGAGTSSSEQSVTNHKGKKA